MIRIILVIVLNFFILSCANPQKRISKNNFTEELVLNLDILIQKKSDTIQKEIYLLKNGYELSFYPAQKGNLYNYNTRLQGKGIDSLIHISGYGEELSIKYYPQYYGIDFNDYFALSWYGGGNCSREMGIYKKSSGEEIITGYEVDYDTKNEVVLYWGIDPFDTENSSYRMLVYDLKSEKYLVIDDEAYDDLCFGSMCYHTFFSIQKVTAKYVYISYWNLDCKKKYVYELVR